MGGECTPGVLMGRCCTPNRQSCRSKDGEVNNGAYKMCFGRFLLEKGLGWLLKGQAECTESREKMAG